MDRTRLAQRGVPFTVNKRIAALKRYVLKTMSNLVTHFEIYADDAIGLVDFYRGVFDWQIEQVPGIDYWRIQTGAAERPRCMAG